ncbi:hypothetical protein [Paenibacillus protaetiae]|nr:hypothetical protein [Paenibacillus protaetiae]
MWNVLASEIEFEVMSLNELRKFLKKSNVIVIDIKPAHSDTVIVFYKGN